MPPPVRVSAVLLASFLATLGAGVEGACAADLQTGPASEKEARTPAQRKINSQLLFEIYRRRGEAERKGVPPGPTDVKIDDAGRALVDVRTDVTPAIEKKIRDLDGVVISTSSQYQSIIARIPILKLERLAEEPSVRAIEPAAEAMTNRPKG
jgi:hypothetical protein